jgi:hypothetical protein
VRKARPLQAIIDPFVKSIDGELVSDLISNRNPPKNADYLFRRYNVIAELKSLQSVFLESFYCKLAELMGDWDRRGLFRVYGRVTIGSSKLPPICREEMFAQMAGPLQNHVIATANKQIRTAKSLLNMPDAKGLLWVASDGNDLQPNEVWYLLCRVLQKRTESGDPAYSSINGIAYFNPRMPAQIPGMVEPTLFWFSGTRRPSEDRELQTCLHMLKRSWWPYVMSRNRIVIRDVDGKPEDVRFPGGMLKPAFIAINYK